MIYQKFTDIYSEQLAEGAIINDRMPGFKEDYLVLHCLLRKHKIRTCFEVGTNTGFGTKIIKNALGEIKTVVYSLDLPVIDSKLSLQHPVNYAKMLGEECDLEYIQLTGNSKTFPYYAYPAQAYYVDGEHDYDHVFTETKRILTEARPKLIVYHDADMPEVIKGIMDGFGWAYVNMLDNDYDLYRVSDTHIAYILKR